MNENLHPDAPVPYEIVDPDAPIPFALTAREEPSPLAPARGMLLHCGAELVTRQDLTET